MDYRRTSARYVVFDVDINGLPEGYKHNNNAWNVSTWLLTAKSVLCLLSCMLYAAATTTLFHTTGGLLLHSISFLVSGRRWAALTMSLQKVSCVENQYPGGGKVSLSDRGKAREHTYPLASPDQRCTGRQTILRVSPSPHWYFDRRRGVLPELLVSRYALHGPQLGVVLLPVPHVLLHIVDQFIFETLEIRRRTHVGGGSCNVGHGVRRVAPITYTRLTPFVCFFRHSSDRCYLIERRPSTATSLQQLQL